MLQYDNIRQYITNIRGYIMALKKGEGMVEFYSLLKVLKSMYENEGFRSAKMLYEKAKSRYKLQMSYEQFNRYYKQEFGSKKLPGSTPKNEEVTAVKSATDHAPVESIEETREEEKTGPIVIRDTQKKPSFNPHAVTIDPKNKW